MAGDFHPPGHSRIKPFTEQDMDDDIDIFHKQRDKIPLDVNNDSDTSEEEMEQPVFDLKGESSDGGKDEESEDEEQLTGLAAKIARQAKFLRQKTGGVEDEMDEVEEEEEEKKAVWGKGKNLYYSADNIDYELQSSDEELPAEEEAEVLRLQRKKAESLCLEDFGLDGDEEDESSADSDGHEETLQEAVKRYEGGLERKKLKETSNRALGKLAEDGKIVPFEEVKKDINALSKEEQMEVVMSDAPELVGLLSEFKDGLGQLKDVVDPLLQKIKLNKNATKEGIGYLEVKQLLLLCYCQSIVYYLLLKAEGHSVRDHPVIARLVEIRNSLDKIQPIDKKVDNEIRRILKDANSVLSESTPEEDGVGLRADKGTILKLRPNSDLVISKLSEALQDGENGHPLVTDSPMEVDDRRITCHENSEANELVGAESQEMLKERAMLEARMKRVDNFSHLFPKSEKKNIKHRKHLRNGLLETLDDFDDDVADLPEIKINKSSDHLHGLQHPRKLSQLVAEAGKKIKKTKLMSGDYDVPEKGDLGERRRRHEMLKSGRSQSPDDVSEGKMEDSLESEDEFYRELKQQRAASLAVKAETYSRNLTIPSKEEEVDGKRHITYQMEKNKGLTPHRKKLTKIPRKKYKMKHQKAVMRRKGQVREVRAPQGPYGGEASGIRTAISRSIRFQN